MNIPCDIVLLPAPDQAELAASCSQILARQGTILTLDNQNFYAHCSLYMLQMDTDNQQRWLDELQKIANNTAVQQLNQAGYYYQDSGMGKGYIDIQYNRNHATDQLQSIVIDICNPLRSGMRQSDIDKMSDASGVKLANLQQYGYPAIGELFRPHITLTKFPADIEPHLDGLPEPIAFDGMFTRLGLFEMGSNGTCVRKIAEFDLQA